MKPFPRHRTRQDFFYTGADGERCEVDMMTNNLVKFNYTHTEDGDDLGRIQVVEIPYAGEISQPNRVFDLEACKGKSWFFSGNRSVYMPGPHKFVWFRSYGFCDGFL